MVVATGLTLNYGAIKGLEGEITSMGDNEIVRKKVGKNGVYSMYFADGAVDTYKGIQELIAKAKAHKGPEKLQALFALLVSQTELIFLQVKQAYFLLYEKFSAFC